MENFTNMNEMMRQPIVNQRYRTQQNHNAGKPMDANLNYRTMPAEMMNNNDSSEAGNPYVLGICYVPIQEWEQVYDEDAAFSAGTIFPSLNKPFLGGGK